LPREIQLYDLDGYDANVFHQEETGLYKYLLELSLRLSIVDRIILSLKQIDTNPKPHTASNFQFYTLILEKGGYSETSVIYVSTSISLHGVTSVMSQTIESCYFL
jgi:hypothetical protein